MSDSNDKESMDASARALIIRNPEYFMAAQEKTLSERIEGVGLTDQELSEIENKQGTKVVRDALLGAFAIGKIAKVFIDWNDGVDKAVKEAKKSHLLETYFNISEENSEAVAKLKRFVTDPYGSVLYNKISLIAEDNPPDPELFNHLAAAIKYISDSKKFEELFSNHKYAISQIEQLTPQALSVLANHEQWPVIYMGSLSTEGSRVTSDYNDQFAIKFAQTKGINKTEIMERLKHSVSELVSRRFIEAYSIKENNVVCKPTRVGSSLIPYLCDNLRS